MDELARRNVIERICEDAIIDTFAADIGTLNIEKGRMERGDMSVGEAEDHLYSDDPDVIISAINDEVTERIPEMITQISIEFLNSHNELADGNELERARDLAQQLIDAERNNLRELEEKQSKELEDVYGNCPICMEEPCDVQLSCSHFFCEECIMRWQEQVASCPTCRHPINEIYSLREQEEIKRLEEEIAKLEGASSFFRGPRPHVEDYLTDIDDDKVIEVIREYLGSNPNSSRGLGEEVLNDDDMPSDDELEMMDGEMSDGEMSDGEMSDGEMSDGGMWGGGKKRSKKRSKKKHSKKKRSKKKHSKKKHSKKKHSKKKRSKKKRSRKY